MRVGEGFGSGQQVAEQKCNVLQGHAGARCGQPTEAQAPSQHHGDKRLTINQSIAFKVHGEPAGVSWDWAGGEGCVSGVHSIGRGTVRCGRQAGWASQACGVEIEGGNKCAKWVRRVV